MKASQHHWYKVFFPHLSCLGVEPIPVYGSEVGNTRSDIPLGIRSGINTASGWDLSLQVDISFCSLVQSCINEDCEAGCVSKPLGHV